jgi:endonuclease I
MKKTYSFLFLLFFTAAIAQVPSGYYSTATGTSYTLKTQLYNIIKGQIDNGYGGLYTTYQTSDVDNFYENDGSVLDMYSEKPNGTDPYNYSTGSTQRCGNYSTEGDCYNREHIIPQSTFGSASPMVSDAHFITPTDGKVNGQRSNYPHGTVATATWTSLNGSKLGSSSVSGYTGTVFEPIDEFKGDIARMYFYFATRYETTVSSYSYPMFNGTSNQVFTTSFLNMLLAWNALDPVNQREIVRNDAIYATQNNRNPYIDHPEYVQQIWNPTADTQAPTAPTSLIASGTTDTTTNLSWNASTDDVAVTGYNIYQGTSLKNTVTGTSYTVTGLTASTAYSFTVKAKDAAGNISASSNTANTTTATSAAATAFDLLFSEYIEGSSFNKALEISNDTGTAVNLSFYAVKKQTNGSGAWSSGINLSGTLDTKTKFTLVNSSISSACYSASSANVSTNATEMNFNGNDAIGLFKNGVLIDIIGKFNGGTANFAANVTLRRKATVTSPNTTFNISAEWDSYSADTCNNLGSKISTTEAKKQIVTDTNDVNIYPNPSNGNFTINNSNEIYSIEVYNLLGQKVFERNNTNATALSISHLNKGVYLIKIIDQTKTSVKKIIIN